MAVDKAPEADQVDALARQDLARGARIRVSLSGTRPGQQAQATAAVLSGLGAVQARACAQGRARRPQHACGARTLKYSFTWSSVR